MTPGDRINAIGDVTTGGVDSTSSTRMISSSGDVLINGAVDSFAFISLIGATVSAGALTSQFNIFVSSPGAVSTGPIRSGSWVGITGGSIATSGLIGAATYVDLSANGAIQVTGAITAGQYIAVDSPGGSLALGNLTAVARSTSTRQATSPSAMSAPRTFNFSAGGAVQGGNIVATNHADGEAKARLSLGNITVTGPPTDGDFSVGSASGNLDQVGNVSATAPSASLPSAI